MSSEFWDTGKPLKNDMGMSIGEEKPKIGEEYYYLVLDKTTVKAVKKKWKNNVFDVVMFRLNNVYSNENEAEENRDAMIWIIKKSMDEI